tara:strand:- start:3014 stop:3418 length:405 start_codon:yes stop_codon:yes gene_type:complete
MIIKLLGYKIRVEIAIICVVLGIIIGVTTMCGCNKENFVAPSRPSTINDNGMGIGVPGQNTGDESWRKHMPNNSEMNMNDNKHDMSFFSKNNFKPECCSYSSYSGSGGCACITSEQSKFVDNRGGNCSGSDCSF